MARDLVPKELAGFFRSLLGPAAKETGEILADPLRYLRLKRLLPIIKKAERLLKEQGVKPRAVDLKVLFPIFQEASLEGESGLSKKWAGLLASAAFGNQIHPSYPKILSELSPGEARLLDMVDEWNKRIAAANKDGNNDTRLILQRTGLSGRTLLKKTGLTEQELPRVMFDLDTRHGLVVFYGQKWEPNLDELWSMTLTPFGKDFVQVCRGPVLSKSKKG